MLGGAFNPPHIGHLVLAREAVEVLGLDRVLLVPYGEAPHRSIEPEPGPEVRLEMVELAVAGDELLEASPIEVERSGPSFTFRTLELLSDERPGDELTFLLGADAAAGLESWREPGRIVELARLGVAVRPGTVIDDAEAALERLGAAQDATVIAMPEIGVSSTGIRRRLAQGRSIRYLVRDEVGELIARRRIYE
ncbi:nicotinate (nicotinamide) nucleotide adenylyltransferase [Thermoleophilia bacterium SCSIO 60948]|nr:nicotinate (nicotinamide) nucleotide adenylyltransferase [Thermoleophilia bacterium SCSIO 60948]